MYKNLLIIDRACDNDAIKRLVALKNWGFPHTKPFEYRSPEDKVILCYSAAVVKGEGIHPPVIPIPPASGDQEGAIHLLCDAANIKVSGCLFPDMSQAPKHLAVLKSYLEHSVSQAVPGTVLTLYWSPHLVNDNTKSILAQSGLLTDDTTLSHKIKRVSFAPQSVFGFGLQPASSFNSSFPSAFSSGSASGSGFAPAFGSQSAKFPVGSFWK